MSSEAWQPTRVLALAFSVRHRKAMASALSSKRGVELVGTLASIAAVRGRMACTSVDVLAVDTQSLPGPDRRDLELECRALGIHLIPFSSNAAPEAAAEHVLEELIHTAGRGAALSEGPAPCVVAIGSSTGGPEALAELLGLLPGDFEIPILIVQHMPSAFTPILARRLEARSQLAIREAVSGEALQPRSALLAPGDYHLELDEKGRAAKLHQGPPENSCRPSVDVLFRSVARVHGAKAVGVVLTGMGRDGLEGARRLRGAGARVLVQDPASSVVWGMPGLIAREGLASGTGGLLQIARWLVEASTPKSPGASSSTPDPGGRP